MSVEVVVPNGMFGANKDYLIDSIIRAISEVHSEPEEWADKYGVNADNDTFSMHKFCWCDGADCPWCEDDAPNFHYKPTDFKVWWYKYIGRDMRMNREVSAKECAEILLACLSAKKQKEA